MSKMGWISMVAMLLGACQSHETPEQAQVRMGRETDSLRTAATVIERRWEGWFAAGQGDSLASVFTESGREMPPHRPAMVGRLAIAKFENENGQVFGSKLTIRGDAYQANGPIGVERGSYTFSGKAKPKAPKGTPATLTEDGKYVIYWRNVNSEWQIEDMIWNSDTPPAMPAPAKKPVHTTKKPTKARKK